MKKISARRARSALLRGGITPLLLAAVVAVAPLESAHAYIDPNAAGPLYQFLFPLIIAATSVIAGLRRRIARFWNRLTGTRDTNIPAEQPVATDSDRPN
jgi:hypothetical protein